LNLTFNLQIKANFVCSYLYILESFYIDLSQINAKIDNDLLKEFRHVIYEKYGLKKGDFKQALEAAMADYVIKYSKSDVAKQLAKSLRDKAK